MYMANSAISPLIPINILSRSATTLPQMIPVITSNRSANAEIAGDGAILIDPENPAESKQAIEQLLESTSYRESVIDSGSQRVKKFTWEGYFEQLVSVYRQVLST